MTRLAFDPKSFLHAVAADNQPKLAALGRKDHAVAVVHDVDELSLC